MQKFKVGDHIIYHKQKVSPKPGPRAEEVEPTAHGEEYWYFVDKYWTVAEVRDDGTLMVRTRRGKVHQLKANDPCIRRAGLIDDWLRKDRFPTLESASENEPLPPKLT